MGTILGAYPLRQKFLLIFVKTAYYITYSDWLDATILVYVTILFMTLILFGNLVSLAYF